MDRRLRSLAPFIVTLVALLTLLPGCGRRGCWDPDETRYAWIAQDMLTRGAWLSPELNGLAYTSKPPPFFWLVAATSWVTADVDLAARLVSILAAAASTGCVFAIGRRLLGPRAALLAAAALLTLVRPAWTFRQALLDPTVTLASTAAVLLLLRSEGAASTRAALGWRACAGLVTGLGFVVKGPVALLGPLLVGVARWRRAPGAGPGQVAAGAFAAAAPALALGALLWADGGLGRGLEVGSPALRHAAGLIDKVNGPLFYVQRLPTDLLPWWPLLPAAGLLALEARRGHALRLLLLWLGGGLLAMSCIPAKRQVYLLPLYPPVALLVGAALARPPRAGRAVWLARAPLAAVLGVEVVGGALAALAVPWLLHGWSPQPGSLEAAWHTALRARAPGSLVALAAGLGLVVTAGGLLGVALLRSGRTARAGHAAAAAALVATVWLGAVAMPLDDVRHSAAPIAAEVASAAARHERLACVGFGAWHPSLPLLTGVTRMAVCLSTAELQAFVGRGPATLILRERELPAVEAALAPRPVRVEARIPQLEDWTLVVRVAGAP